MTTVTQLSNSIDTNWTADGSRPIEWLRDEYRAHLNATHGEATARNHFNSVNHVFLRLSPADLLSPRMRHLYWENLSPAMRRICGGGWTKYREWVRGLGMDIPDFPAKSRMRFPHPLFSDMARLASAYSSNRLQGMCWSDLDDCEPVYYRSAERIFAFLTGGAEPLRWNPVVPKDARMEAMPDWGIDTIINSADPDATRDAEQFMVDFIEASFPAKLTAAELLESALLLTRTHDRLRRATDPKKLTGDVLTRLRMGDYAGARAGLIKVATEPHPDECADLW